MDEAKNTPRKETQNKVEHVLYDFVNIILQLKQINIMTEGISLI